jgi:hypothetical protein
MKHVTGYTSGAPSVYFAMYAPADRASRSTIVTMHGGAHSGYRPMTGQGGPMILLDAGMRSSCLTGRASDAAGTFGLRK